MELKTLDEIRTVAQVLPVRPRRPLSKSERLEYWADALEREAGTRLTTLRQMEYAAPEERLDMRADNSPLSVAFNDPRLRSDGLAGDTVRDAVAFFGIGAMELHDILCFCHHGATMAAETAAMRVRDVVTRRRVHRGLTFIGGFVVLSMAVGALIS